MTDRRLIDYLIFQNQKFIIPFPIEKWLTFATTVMDHSHSLSGLYSVSRSASAEEGCTTRNIVLCSSSHSYKLIHSLAVAQL